MTYRPVTPVPAARAVLLAVLAAVAAAVVGQLVGVGVSEYLQFLHRTPDANIGAGMALILLPLLVTPPLAWPLVRIVRLPYPLLTVLLATTPYLLLAGWACTVWLSMESDSRTGSPLDSFLGSLWSLAAVNVLALCVSLVPVALLTSRHHARAHARTP